MPPPVYGIGFIASSIPTIREYAPETGIGSTAQDVSVLLVLLFPLCVKRSPSPSAAREAEPDDNEK
jgi:hypothetical protein